MPNHKFSTIVYLEKIRPVVQLNSMTETDCTILVYSKPSYYAINSFREIIA